MIEPIDEIKKRAQKRWDIYKNYHDSVDESEKLKDTEIHKPINKKVQKIVSRVKHFPHTQKDKK